MKKTKIDPIDTMLADLITNDVMREIAAGRPDRAKAIAAMIGVELTAAELRGEVE